jgi:RecJ-like exonuclease
LREARDYSFLLNCCCIQSKPSVGLAISIGNRTSFLLEAEEYVKYLEANIREVILKIMSEKWRIRDIGTTVWINLDTSTRDCNLHLLSSLLSGYSEFQGKIIIIRTETANSHYMYLIRELPGLQSTPGIGTHAHRLANELGGSSNRSDSFVECIVSSSTVDNFDSRLKKVIDNSRGD